MYCPFLNGNKSFFSSVCSVRVYFLPTHLSIYLPIYLSFSLSLYLSICSPIDISIYLSLYLSISQSIYLSILPSMYLSYQSIYMFDYPTFSIYLSICLHIHLFITCMHPCIPPCLPAPPHTCSHCCSLSTVDDSRGASSKSAFPFRVFFSFSFFGGFQRRWFVPMSSLFCF